MKTIGVRELRQHASRYLALVEAGEEVTITNRGRTVARLVPISEGERSLEALIEAGVLLPSRKPWSLPRVDDLPEGNLSAHLDDLRGER